MDLVRPSFEAMKTSPEGMISFVIVVFPECNIPYFCTYSVMLSTYIITPLTPPKVPHVKRSLAVKFLAYFPDIFGDARDSFRPDPNTIFAHTHKDTG